MKLIGIAVRDARKAPMCELKSVQVTEEAGLAGDYRGKPGSRQVTVMSQDSWSDACSEVEKILRWTTRRANFLIEGKTFGPDDVGSILKIGDMRLRINKELEPCYRMEEYCVGLEKALSPQWRGGVCCTVNQDGEARLGDDVEILPVDQTS